MRTVFFVLLLVNLLYFAWAQWLTPPQRVEAAGSIAKLPRLMLTPEKAPAGAPAQ